MKAVIQKSGAAKVKIDEEIAGEIKSGLVILLGITHSDKEEDVEYLVEKIANLRLFSDEDKHFEASILDRQKEALIISQFTLYASCNKGRRPDFNEAAKPDVAKPLYEKFIEKLEEKGIKVATGEFGAMMHVSLTNEGPTTIIIESKK